MTNKIATTLENGAVTALCCVPVLKKKRMEHLRSKMENLIDASRLLLDEIDYLEGIGDYREETHIKNLRTLHKKVWKEFKRTKEQYESLKKTTRN